MVQQIMNLHKSVVNTLIYKHIHPNNLEVIGWSFILQWSIEDST